MCRIESAAIGVTSTDRGIPEQRGIAARRQRLNPDTITQAVVGSVHIQSAIIHAAYDAPTIGRIIDELRRAHAALGDELPLAQQMVTSLLLLLFVDHEQPLSDAPPETTPDGDGDRGRTPLRAVPRRDPDGTPE